MFIPVKNLLSIGSDVKTVKGEKLGILTGVLYLAPHNLSGYQVCPKASEGCKLACLYTAGRGVYTRTQESRMNKTRWFFEHKESFLAELVSNIEGLIRKAKRLNMVPCVRLNGTSDLPWEKIKVIRKGVEYASMMEAFPDMAFYDYSKILNRHKAISLNNYHLTFSLSENNDADAHKALKQGYNVAVVMSVRTRKTPKPDTWSGFPVVDGDESDVRFLDPKGGHIVALFPKGKGRKDTSGFVREPNSTLKAA